MVLKIGSLNLHFPLRLVAVYCHDLPEPFTFINCKFLSCFHLVLLALLKRQGINVKGLLKAESPKEEEPQTYIDCTGDLQVMCKQLMLFYV